ncbi:MAG: hypothetical protein U5J95_11760 [Balneolaceae bacterium]|nr:hypothetical protein [Balneolaceae bacterium]
MERIASKNKSLENIQVGFIALNKQGQYGGYAMRKGFDYAVHTSSDNELLDSESYLKA